MFVNETFSVIIGKPRAIVNCRFCISFTLRFSVNPVILYKIREAHIRERICASLYFATAMSAGSFGFGGVGTELHGEGEVGGDGAAVFDGRLPVAIHKTDHPQGFVVERFPGSTFQYLRVRY